jgi:hypothetical protein
MHAAAANPTVAKQAGVPQTVAKEYVKGDHQRGPKSLPETIAKGVKS